MEERDNVFGIIRRSIPAARVVISHRLRPGRIYIFSDADGGSIGPYLELWQGRPSGAIEWHGEPDALQGALRVGPADQLPQEPVAEFLLRSGASEQGLPALLKNYELSSVSYLPCTQLSATAQRQLSLLRVLLGDAGLYLLNDPFQPFNGRWREEFAGALLRKVRESHCLMLAVNIGFFPCAWLEQPEISMIDVGEAEFCARRAREQQATQQKPAPQKQVQQKQAPAAAADATVAAALAQLIAEPHGRQMLLKRLAALSMFLRGWSGALALCCAVVLVAALGLVFLPGLGAANSVGGFVREWQAGKLHDAQPARHSAARAGAQPDPGAAASERPRAEEPSALARSTAAAKGVPLAALLRLEPLPWCGREEGLLSEP